MNAGSIVLWGFIATVVLTMAMFASQALGFSRMSIPYLLGTMFTPGRDRARIIGLAVHFMNGWIFSFIYGFAFESMEQATWYLGAAFGLIHGMFVLLVAMPMMPGMHPRMASNEQGPTPTQQLEPPGFLALNYGMMTPVVTMISHLIYGAILGGYYRLHSSIPGL